MSKSKKKISTDDLVPVCGGALEPMSPPKPKPKPKPKAKKPKAKVPISIDAKITVLVKDNPRRKGTAHSKRFGLYQTGETVAEYLKKGGNRGDLRCDIRDGFVKVK